MRRVVVTGIGLLTPLGWGVEKSWKGIVEGRSGIGPITSFDTTGYGCTIAGEVPSVDGRGGGGEGERPLPVALVLCRPDGSDRRRVLDCIGGQGTMNVPNWSPDSRAFAFVHYDPL